MEIAELKINIGKESIFTHIEKGHRYKVKDLLLSKHPETGKWYDAVLYQRLDDAELFVRSVESFLDNFKVYE